MKRMIGCALIALVLSAAEAPVMGQFFGGRPGQPPPSEEQVQQDRIHERYAEAQWRAATEAVKEKQEAVAKGVAPQSDLQAAELRLLDAQANLQLATNQLKQQETALQLQEQLQDRISALRRPVTVELRDSPVRQAAQTLSQASGVPISADKDVPADKRLTVVAQDVPLGTVLDTVARQTGLLIAPEGSGVLLKLAPSLEVNGQRAGLLLPFEPWTNEWGQNPTMATYGIPTFPSVSMSPRSGYADPNYSSVPTSRREPGPDSSHLTPYVAAPGGLPMPTVPDGSIIQGTPRPGAAPPGYGGPGPGPGAPPPGYGRPGAGPAPGNGMFGEGGIGGYGQGSLGPPPVTMAPGFFGSGGIGGYGGGLGGYGPGAAAAPPVTMTALSSNTFVVASPAAGPGGEPAVMLTVYRLEGTTLRKVSSVLHRLGPAGARRGPVGIGSPGGFGPGRFGYGPDGIGGPGVVGPRPQSFFAPGSPAPAPPGSSPYFSPTVPQGSPAPRAVPAPGASGPLDRPDTPHGAGAPDTAPVDPGAPPQH